MNLAGNKQMMLLMKIHLSKQLAAILATGCLSIIAYVILKLIGYCLRTKKSNHTTVLLRTNKVTSILVDKLYIYI